ncbi:hypothetical protein C0J52_08600 [Blattella germanica]|nr:hypothetical protein C0J52_08600 [Blattella germanica]
MTVGVSKCCCSVPLERGVNIIGTLLILRSSVLLAFACVMLANLNHWSPQIDLTVQDDITVSFIRALLPIMVLWIVVNVTEIVANVILRWRPGDTVRYRKSLLEWLRAMHLFAMLYVVVLPAIAFMCLHSGFTACGAAVIAWSIFHFGSSLYCYIVVRSHYKNMLDEVP